MQNSAEFTGDAVALLSKEMYGDERFGFTNGFPNGIPAEVALAVIERLLGQIDGLNYEIQHVDEH